MEGIVVSHIRSSSPGYRQVWDLREEILRIPIGLSLKNEDLSGDWEDDIFIAKHNDQIIACLMLHPIGKKQVQFRQMAVCNEWQGKGVGKLLVVSAEKFCFDKGCRKIILHARKVAVGFYEKLGYSISGNEFVEVGMAHYMMEKHMPA
jgi:predicted GNAT family N-acyltransferase